MDEYPYIQMGSLSEALDTVFGEHDSAGFIRREEEKLIEEGTTQKQSQAKLEEGEQQKRAIKSFIQKASISQELEIYSGKLGACKTQLSLNSIPGNIEDKLAGGNRNISGR